MRAIVDKALEVLFALLVLLTAALWVLAPKDPSEPAPPIAQLRDRLRLIEGDARGYPPQAPSTGGLPTASDTYDQRDQGTDWPVDAFTSMVSGHISPRSIASPAMHSYDGDGNMEGITAFPPFAHQEDRTDLGGYTGAVGPAGGSTPESHPELTAP